MSQLDGSMGTNKEEEDLYRSDSLSRCTALLAILQTEQRHVVSEGHCILRYGAMAQALSAIRVTPQYRAARSIACHPSGSRIVSHFFNRKDTSWKCPIFHKSR